MQWDVGHVEAQSVSSHPPSSFNRVLSFVLPSRRKFTAFESDWLTRWESSWRDDVCWRWLKNFQASGIVRRSVTSHGRSPFQRLSDCTRLSRRRFSNADRFSLMNFIKFHPSCASEVSTRLARKLTRFDASPKAPSKSKSKLRRRYTAARTINPRSLLTPGNGVTRCGCCDRPIQSTHLRDLRQEFS